MKKIYYGENIITMNDTVAEAVKIEDGTIKKVGKLSKFEAEMTDSSIEKIDLQDKTMLPGFVDPHGHISVMGQLSVMANLRECESFADVVDTLTTYIKENNIAKGEVVVGFGYDHNFLKEESHPTKEVLNQVSTEHPIFISHVSGHVGCANDAALKMAGIDANTPDKEGGVIGRIKDTNKPNGYLAEENQLKIDIVAYPTIADNPEDMQQNNTYAKKYYNRLKIGGYKMFLDGSPQGKTAWMTEPYEGEESYRGYPWFQDEQVKTFVSQKQLMMMYSF